MWDCESKAYQHLETKHLNLVLLCSVAHSRRDVHKEALEVRLSEVWAGGAQDTVGHSSSNIEGAVPKWRKKVIMCLTGGAHLGGGEGWSCPRT